MASMGEPHSSSSQFPQKTPQFSLSSDQFQRCSHALPSLKHKLNTPHLIQREFDSLQDKTTRPSDMTKLFDSTRVVLSSCEDYRPSSRGNINASFIKNPAESAPQFIATQGPLPHTYEDFWEMVFQYRCLAIVMLTESVDNYRMEKCGYYFQAENGPREFGDISVVTQWIMTTENSLVLRHLEVTKAESEEPPLSVLHILYPEWPDYGVPKNSLAVREIFKRTYHLLPGVGPVVVHCGAGIGRTGTYCTIHDTIQQILAGNMSALYFAQTVEVLRSQRAGMVETSEQYKYCYKVVIDELEELISVYNP